MSLTYVNTNDYEITFQDYFTGQYINLGSDGNFCGVQFDGVGVPELREAVYELSGGDGIRFGIERQNGITWNITGSIHSGSNSGVRGSSDSAWNTWSSLARSWSGYPERATPRSVVPLYFKRPGREQMVVYGRPNRLDPTIAQSYVGFISYTATFRQSDPKFYSATTKQTTLGLTEIDSGGIIVNDGTDIKLPFTTTSAVPVTGSVTNSGDIDSSPIIVITGEVVNPIVSYLDALGNIVWSVEIRATVQEGDSVTIDTRQWERSVTQADGTSLSGLYNGNRLQDITILPGTGLIRYGATSGSLTTNIQVTYRDAWVST